MTGLKFTSPRAFAQSLRQRLDALPDTVAIAVVEGKSDKQTLISFLHPTSHVVAARGKDMVLGARSHLTSVEMNRLAIIIDCDGQSTPQWFSERNVIVTSYRDMDADLILLLGTFDTVISDFLAVRAESAGELMLIVANLRAFVVELTALFGVVTQAARSLSLRVKIVDTKTQSKERVRLPDLDDLHDWIRSGTVPTIGTLAKNISLKLGWTEEELNRVINSSTSGGTKPCRSHRTESCSPCMTRQFSNGHDLVDLTAVAVLVMTGYTVSEGEVARLFRTARVASSIENWPLVDRLRVRQSEIGIPLLAS